jgi:hypothetical protein
MLYYVVTEGRARKLDRINLRDRATYGLDWMVFPANGARDAVRQWGLFKAGRHPRQGELELEVSQFRASEPGYDPVWEAETEAIASQAAQSLEAVEARRDALEHEQAELADVQETLKRAANLAPQRPRRRTTGGRSSAGVKRRKRAA